ncbi:MAG: hypothetical protein ACRDUA_16655, partial [Micromonosporaceae bacterium]
MAESAAPGAAVPEAAVPGAAAAGLAQASELVMRDLIDVLVSENLFGLRSRMVSGSLAALAGVPLDPDEHWCRLDVGDQRVAWRAVPATVLLPYRFSRGPVWTGSRDGVSELAPDELLELLLAEAGEASGAAVAEDLRTAVEHAAVTLAAPRPEPGSGARRLIWGERLAATRDRPFHPTARATVGWTVAERARYGPTRSEPLGLAWA